MSFFRPREGRIGRVNQGGGRRTVFCRSIGRGSNESGSSDSKDFFLLRPTRFNEPREPYIARDVGLRSCCGEIELDFPVVFYSSMKNFSTCVVFSPLYEGKSFFFHEWIGRENPISLNLFLLLRCLETWAMRVDLQWLPPFLTFCTPCSFIFKKIIAKINSELFFIFRSIHLKTSFWEYILITCRFKVEKNIRFFKNF